MSGTCCIWWTDQVDRSRGIMRAPRMTTDYTASELQPGSNGKCGHPEPDLERGLLEIANIAAELGREPSGGKVRLTASPRTRSHPPWRMRLHGWMRDRLDTAPKALCGMATTANTSKTGKHIQAASSRTNVGCTLIRARIAGIKQMMKALMLSSSTK